MRSRHLFNYVDCHVMSFWPDDVFSLNKVSKRLSGSFRPKLSIRQSFVGPLCVEHEFMKISWRIRYCWKKKFIVILFNILVLKFKSFRADWSFFGYKFVFYSTIWSNSFLFSCKFHDFITKKVEYESLQNELRICHLIPRKYAVHFANLSL